MKTILDLIRGAWEGITPQGRTLVLVVLMVLIGFIVFLVIKNNVDIRFLGEYLD